jgi:hypothetical protein
MAARSASESVMIVSIGNFRPSVNRPISDGVRSFAAFSMIGAGGLHQNRMLWTTASLMTCSVVMTRCYPSIATRVPVPMQVFSFAAIPTV